MRRTHSRSYLLLLLLALGLLGGQAWAGPTPSPTTPGAHPVADDPDGDDDAEDEDEADDADDAEEGEDADDADEGDEGEEGEDAAEGEDAEAEAEPEIAWEDIPDPMPGAPWDELTTGLEKIEGLFTFWRNNKTGQVLIEIGPDQIGPQFLLSTTLNAGSGGGIFIAPMMWGDRPIYFEQSYKNLYLMQKNTNVRAAEHRPISRAVETGTSDSILVTLQPMSEPHAETKAMLYDASMIFLMADLAGLSQGSFFGVGGYGMDPMSSSISRIDNFPENTNVEVTANIMGGGMDLGIFGAGPAGGPDPRSQIAKLVFALSKVPENNGFESRHSDDRIGYFLTMHQNFSHDDDEDRYVRFINRWNLVKQDPTAAVSDPVEPIVYWIENTCPTEYRAAVKEGVEIWQEAFEAAGFSNAIIAKEMPDDAEWDPADVRYNTIRWFVAPGAAFAIGPSRANPFTGQIYDADIGFSADMMFWVSQEYKYTLNPMGRVAHERNKARLFGAELPPTVFELPAYTQAQSAGQDPAEALGWAKPLAAPLASRLHQGCMIGDEMVMDAAGSYRYLVDTGLMEPGSVDEKEFVRQFLVAITAHEVGHTLGLRHNYKGSIYHDYDDLGNGAEDVSASVMDYTATNIASRDRTQGLYHQMKVGPYDIQAIKYGYDPDADRTELEAIASQIAQPGHEYATDEDTFGWTMAIDPTSQAWDLAGDQLTWYGDQLQIGKELLSSLDWNLRAKGTRYQRYRKGFGWAMGHYANVAMNLPRYIGGIYHHRHRVGDLDGQNPYVPVPAQQQRDALQLIIDGYWAPEAFALNYNTLQKLAVEREPDFAFSAFFLPRDFPVHDMILGLQTMPLAWVYDPMVLGRIQNTTLMLPADADKFTMAELFTRVREAIWTAPPGGVDSVRRNLQRQHLTAVGSIYLFGTGWYPEDAQTLARADLGKIKATLAEYLKDPALDTTTRAHYEETVVRIDEALSADMIRFNFAPMY